MADDENPNKEQKNEQPKLPKQPRGQQEVPVTLLNGYLVEDEGLQNVYGSDKFKSELEDIILGMKGGPAYRMMGVNPPKSFMFTGPPGTGKTYSIRNIASELAKDVLPENVALMKYDIGTMGTAYINMGSVNMQNFFNVGKTIVDHPDVDIHSVIYFVDECDALLTQRGSGSQAHKEDDKLLETIMKNLQEINDRETNEFIFFATNFPEALDKAAVRSGRIDKKVEFPLPDYDMRKGIIEGYIEKYNKERNVLKGIKPYILAEMSNGFNCADLNQCFADAIQERVKKELKREDRKLTTNMYVSHKRLEDAFKEMKNRKAPTKKRIGYI
ncbi:MAG: AAA family ATPase [bacterium]